MSQDSLGCFRPHRNYFQDVFDLYVYHRDRAVVVDKYVYYVQKFDTWERHVRTPLSPAVSTTRFFVFRASGSTLGTLRSGRPICTPPALPWQTASTPRTETCRPRGRTFSNTSPRRTPCASCPRGGCTGTSIRRASRPPDPAPTCSLPTTSASTPSQDDFYD